MAVHLFMGDTVNNNFLKRILILKFSSTNYKILVFLVYKKNKLFIK